MSNLKSSIITSDTNYDFIPEIIKNPDNFNKIKSKKKIFVSSYENIFRDTYVNKSRIKIFFNFNKYQEILYKDNYVETFRKIFLKFVIFGIIIHFFLTKIVKIFMDLDIITLNKIKND